MKQKKNWKELERVGGGGKRKKKEVRRKENNVMVEKFSFVFCYSQQI